jgi:amino acid transporter
MALAIGSSVAELVSAYPTAGGMYYVTKHVVPPGQVPLFAWTQGWCNLLGQTAGVSSVAYTVSQMLLACVSMNSDLIDGEYSYSPYVNIMIESNWVLINYQNPARPWHHLFIDYQNFASNHPLVRSYQ